MVNYWLEPLVSFYKNFFGEVANIIFDVGTRDGDDAEFLRLSLNGKNIYAIEARPEAALKTKENYPEINVIQTAISNYTGTTKFYSILSDRKDYVGSSSIFNTKFGKPEYPYEIINLNVTTMCNVINTLGLSGKDIDLMKVDIEGFTFECLEGMHEHYKRVKMFHLETEIESTHDNHRNNKDVEDFMRANSFRLVSKQYEWGDGIEDQIWLNLRYV